MYTNNEKKIVKVLVDDLDLQDRLFTNFDESETKELVYSVMEVEILRKIYGDVFSHFVSRVHAMFGETKGDILIDILAKLRLENEELVLETVSN